MRAFIDPNFSLGATRDYLILGIDKLHAQIGAGADENNPVYGEWQWGNPGVFYSEVGFDLLPLRETVSCAPSPVIQ